MGNNNLDGGSGGNGGGSQEPLPTWLNIGDYVDYQSHIDQSKEYVAKISLTGHLQEQRIRAETGLKWRVMHIDKTRNEITLISETPTGNKLELDGVVGYNNVEIVLEELSSKLYTTPKGEARSMNFRDIETIVSGEVLAGEGEYSGKLSREPDSNEPNGYKENATGKRKSDWKRVSKNGDKITEQLVFGKSGNYEHWLASHAVDANYQGVDYYAGLVYSGNASSRRMVFV